MIVVLIEALKKRRADHAVFHFFLFLSRGRKKRPANRVAPCDKKTKDKTEKDYPIG